MVPLIEDEVVNKKKWIEQDDFLDLLAIAQSAPGILSVNIAIFVGYRLRGVKGSLVTSLGSILPSFLMILAIALFFSAYKDNPYVEKVFKGIRHGQESQTHLDHHLDSCGCCLAHLAHGCFTDMDYHHGWCWRLSLWAME